MIDRQPRSSGDLTRRRFLQGSAMAGVAAFLAACGTKGTSAPPSVAASAATESAAVASASAAAPSASVTPSALTNAGGVLIDRNIANEVSGIVLAPQHSKTMVAPVERAVNQGMPVLIIDSGLENQDIIVQYVSTNNYHGGELAAQHLLKILAEQGKPAPSLILFRYQVGSESTDQREKGFEDVVDRTIEEQKKAGKPTVTWLSRDKFAGATKDSARREAEPLLNNLRDKGIDGMFAPNESSASGTVDALRSLDLNKKLRLVGFDSSAPLLQALRDGDIDALILQDPYRMGYLGVWNLVHHLEGYKIEPKVMSTGEYVITKDNLDDQSTRELFDPKLQEQRKIEPPVFRKKTEK